MIKFLLIFIIKVKVFGTLELGKACSINEFWVDTRGMIELIGALTVHIAGPSRTSAHLNIYDHKDGLYKVEYKVCFQSKLNLN